MVKHFLAGGTGVKNSTRGAQVENFVAGITRRNGPRRVPRVLQPVMS